MARKVTDETRRKLAHDATRYPTLARLLREGVLTLNGIDICGTAADGVSVSVGDTYNLADAERYLAAHPTPDTW